MMFERHRNQSITAGAEPPCWAQSGAPGPDFLSGHSRRLPVEVVLRGEITVQEWKRLQVSRLARSGVGAVGAKWRRPDRETSHHRPIPCRSAPESTTRAG